MAMARIRLYQIFTNNLQLLGGRSSSFAPSSSHRQHHACSVSSSKVQRAKVFCEQKHGKLNRSKVIRFKKFLEMFRKLHRHEIYI